MNYELNLGTNSHGLPIIWKDTANPHISISGSTGYGKSVLNCSISSQLVQQGFHCVHIDSSNELGSNASDKPANWPPSNIRYLNVCRSEVPVATFHPITLNGGTKENPTFTAARYGGILKDALKLGPSMTDYVTAILKEDFHTRGVSSIHSIARRIEDGAQEKNPVAVRMRYKFQAFDPFPETQQNYDAAFREPGVTVINTSSITVSSLCTSIPELIMSNLWSYKTSNPNTCGLFLFLDEFQNLRCDKDSMVARIIQEGRKYHFAVCLSTQQTTEEKGHPLGRTGLRIFLRPEIQDLESAAKALSVVNPELKDRYKAKLSSLLPGQYIFCTKSKPVFVDGRTQIRENITPADLTAVSQ